MKAPAFLLRESRGLLHMIFLMRSENDLSNAMINVEAHACTSRNMKKVVELGVVV